MNYSLVLTASCWQCCTSGPNTVRTVAMSGHQAPWVESISTAVVSGIQRHAQYAHVETEAAQQHQTRLQKLCDNFWSRVWFCCSRVRTNQKKVVKTTFQFQAIFPNQTLHQKDVTESAPLRSRREASAITRHKDKRHSSVDSSSEKFSGSFKMFICQRTRVSNVSLVSS